MNKTFGRIAATTVLSLGVATGAQAVAHAAPSTESRSETVGVTAAMLRNTDDARLDSLVALLDSLPADLKNADPRTTPNYEQRLAHALAPALAQNPGAQAALAPAQADATTLGVSYLATNWFWCAFQIAKFVIEVGFPAAKILSTIKKARAIYGSFRNIYRVIRAGHGAEVFGAEGVKILEKVIGIDGIVSACS